MLICASCERELKIIIFLKESFVLHSSQRLNVDLRVRENKLDINQN